ncbi:hypothetical protein PMIT1327_00305 [Prochlorococcus marinus str. MIT 1327]|nr:hypothetical protein PMIT1327_00305 [Prochlorococcus marinus str. MIT 1327]
MITQFLGDHKIFKSKEQLRNWLCVESGDDLTEEGESVHEDPESVENNREEWIQSLRERLFTYW